MGVVALTGGIYWLASEAGARLVGMSPENRLVLYEFRRSVGPEMTEQELKALLESVADEKLEYRWSDKGLSVWTNIGFMRTYYLLIELRDGRVVHASIRDGEGDSRRIEDAPPDF